MAFVSGSHAVFHHDAGDSYVDTNQTQLHQHSHYVNPANQDPSQTAFYNSAAPHQLSCDIKPRLTKEQHDILEAHYQKQNKPNTNTKKGFAESLNVSLDKVNNWFQNRRAKAKQDAKKQAGAYNLFTSGQQQSSNSLNFSSDSEASPAFSSAEYYSMMQQCSADDQMSGSAELDPAQRFQDQALDGTRRPTGDEQQYHNFSMPQQLSVDMYETPQELNRRTLTQEQFDAFAHNSGMMHADGHFDPFQNDFPSEGEHLHQVFTGLNGLEFKQDSFSFNVPVVAPMSSSDSSLPSTISEQSMFPSSTTIQDQPAISATSSEWADSRSSSVSVAPTQESAFPPASVAQPQSAQFSTKWQPGQSIPVDPNELQQHFREVSQRQAQQQAQQQQLQQTHHEQPLAWPADEAYPRRDSQSQTVLAQQMSSFAIQTPQPSQSAAFSCPPPPIGAASSIAARRQRPRPAALGLASLRSQSYSGAAQPSSPNTAHPQNVGSGQTLRRIRSSNVINSVAQGRVMKSTPGSAQRSPLSWTFADAMNSPKAARHASTGSSGNLAPPTPLSPTEFQASGMRSQFPPWQSSGHFSRPASISESDAEHTMSGMSSAGSQPQTATTTSPPQTPMFHHHHQQHFSQQHAVNRIGSTVITENTPPQSAPACQQTFSSDVFASAPPQQALHNQTFLAGQAVPFMGVSMPERQFAMPPQYYAVPVPEVQHTSLQFSQGVPVVDAQGNLTMAFPPQMQQMQYVQNSPQMSSPSQQGQHGQFNYMSGAEMAPAMQVTAQLPKQQQPAPEFFVHEYSPPQDLKRSATVRKITTDSGPKNYTFANQTPEHFEKDKPKKAHDSKSPEAISSSQSPASAASGS